MKERKMKQNNCKTKLKAIIAVMLVMVSLFAMASMVNAGIVELIFGDEYEVVAMATSSSCHHQWHKESEEVCAKCKQTITTYKCGCGSVKTEPQNHTCSSNS